MNRTLLPLLIAMAVALVSCKKSESGPSDQAATNDKTPLKEKGAAESDVVEHYAKLVSATYGDALAQAQALQSDVNAFLSGPTADLLQKARDSWTAARLPYLQTEVFRFYEGPIDDEDGPEGLLNAWPMDEAYIDYVEGSASSGLVNNVTEFPKIDAALIESLNEKDGEANISCGYHAIEFLLWGQDLSAEGPGNRAHTDYTTADNASRRGDYLRAVTNLVVEKLEGLVAEWMPGKDNYRAEFQKLPSSKALEKIMTGMSMLSGFEMAAERLNVAYDTKAQEDEHSCFSDTTHNDMVYDLTGIHNVWTGSYGDLSGPGLQVLAQDLKPDLAGQLGSKIEESVAAAKAIPVPFDQAILGEDTAPGRMAILHTIETLEDQAELLVALAKEMGFGVPISEEEE
ncbi:MAG TPA: iron-regulated protein [Verrucomicrobiales bacterium]|mgnify:FL=1|nr:iron-regulated protein [Verrucomicrobiales bacterium]|tara:strand:+ start:1433 stop:2632 length:1200 start_codon:yes stop_codon:yes gene_type:complete